MKLIITKYKNRKLYSRDLKRYLASGDLIQLYKSGNLDSVRDLDGNDVTIQTMAFHCALREEFSILRQFLNERYERADS